MLKYNTWNLEYQNDFLFIFADPYPAVGIEYFVPGSSKNSKKKKKKITSSS
jgi:hypothetical protein